MDFNSSLKPNRETIFKDSVLSLAEAKSMEIIAEAGKNRSVQLEQAYEQCEEADYKTIRARLAMGGERSVTAHAQAARQKLLLRRKELVDGIFSEVEERLRDFVGSGGYKDYLFARLALHAEILAAGEGTVVCLREGDAKWADDILEKYPGVQVETDERIRIGGLTVSDGRVLYDETLDQALNEQREGFYHSGPLAM